MKRLTPSLLAALAIATTGLCASGVSRSSVYAAVSPGYTAISPGTEPFSQPMLMASRLGFRFRVHASQYRRGGFSRGDSCSSAMTVTALTPRFDSEGNPLGDQAPAYLTASDHPTFFFHVSSLPVTTGKLTLRQLNVPLTQSMVYETDFTFNGESGIVGIQMPDSAPALQSGAEYAWQVSMACAPGNTEDSLTLMGGVLERVSHDADTPAEQLSFYTNQGIWQDAIALMAESVYTNPSDTAIAHDLSRVLEEAGLGAIANAPIVQISEGQ